jgi:outer membrane protein assembly factor BamC
MNIEGDDVKVYQAKWGVLALAALLALSGCSWIEGEKIDYKSAGKGVSLEVPPDMTQLSRDSRYQVPGGTVTASAYQVGQAAPSLPTAATALGDVRIERAGSERYLVVNRPADKLWEPVREFWQENGFLLTTDQPALGIMETDWAENRARIPQDFIRNILGKVLDSVYSTPERDKFRTRMERTQSGGTEIFVSHRGMIEVYDSASKDTTVWQPRPADPEIEAEFLRRLMVKLGTPADQARNLVASAPAKPTSRVTSVNGTPALEVDDGFDRAWRRVGLALDRTGFTVEDRDRSAGTYFVRYVEPSSDRKSGGLFSKLFSKDDASNPVKYRIAVKPQTGDKTVVSVLNSTGGPEASATAQKIVTLLQQDLR